MSKVSLPERFSGDRNALRGFLNQLELVFTLQATRYPSDSVKIATVGTLLTGKALAWFSPIIENQRKFIRYPTLKPNRKSS